MDKLSTLLGKCIICEGHFAVGEMAYLKGCGDSFHSWCIKNYIEKYGKCPTCSVAATVKDVKVPKVPGVNCIDTAISCASRVYNDVTKKSGEKERNILLEILNNIASAFVTRAKVAWSKVFKFLTIASFVAVLSFFVFLCAIWGDVVQPFAGKAAAVVWNLISGLGALLFNHNHWTDICDIVSFFSLRVMSNSDFKNNCITATKIPKTIEDICYSAESSIEENDIAETKREDHLTP